MNRITFTGHCLVINMGTPTIVLKMDEAGNKEASIFFDDNVDDPDTDINAPQRVLKAFSGSAIEKILSKDEIPNDAGYIELDGCSYEITITKDEITKVYSADDCSIVTYPLLKYLASWSRRLIKCFFLTCPSTFPNQSLSLHPT